jgi:16S rRNA (adenine1518-N6/adenine1519-N6)-dimethyltransferase
VFVPPPKVKSAVIRLTRNDRLQLECDEGLFFRVVKTAFNQRRKTLRNALRPLVAEFESTDFEFFAGKRAEVLSVDDFVRLTRIIQTEKK